MIGDPTARSRIYEPPEAGFPYVGIVMVGAETMACCATETREEAERALAELRRAVEVQPTKFDA
jgi:hypothetical protein